MRDSADIWKTNRVPTRTERTIGFCAGILLGVILLMTSIYALITDNFVISAIFLTLACFAARTAYRAAFAEPSLPKLQHAKVLNYLFIVAGSGMLLLVLFAPQTSNILYLASIGITSVGAGFYNLWSTNE